MIGCLAMVTAASALKYSILNPDVVARPPVNPEFWREVNLTTVKRIPYSRAVGALVHQAMRSAWLCDVPLVGETP